MEIILSLIAGVIGGLAAGGVLRTLDMGRLINSIAGVIGGGGAGYMMAMLSHGAPPPQDPDAPVMVATMGGLDIGIIITQLAAGGIGAGLLLAVLAGLRSLIRR